MAGVENTGSSTDNVELLIGEPLDTMQVKINGKNGVQKTVPALHIGFMEVREYMHFKLLPVMLQDTGQNITSAEEEEWLESISFLEDDLHWLLRLPHHRFWSQVVNDEDLHKCLESYLTMAPRDYDIVSLKIKEDIRTNLIKIHRLIFLVFLRMSTYKESKESHIRPKAYGDLIYDNFVFDVPKLMDLCVLYGFQNKAVLTKMIKNIFTSQPKYLDDLVETSCVALNAFNFAEEELFLNVPEKHGGCRRLEDNTPTGIKEMPLPLFYKIIAYITDTCATIYMFLEIYSPACRIFYQNGAIMRLISFYEQTFPALEKEVKRLSKTNADKNILETIEEKITLSKSLLIKMFRNILCYCCIQHILDPDSKEERFSNILPEEEFLDIFIQVASEKVFLHEYNVVYPFESDMELLIEKGIHLDAQRLNYIFGSIHEDPDPYTADPLSSTANNGARPKTQFKKPSGSLTNMHSVASILKPDSEKSLQNGEDSSEYGEYGSGSRPSDLQMESLIQSVRDILPDLGEGFVEEGLEYFGFDAAKLIDAIFQNNLPICLATLERNLQRVPKPAKSSVLSERRNIYDNDEFDLFSGNNVDMKNIHIEKKNKTPNSYQTLDTEEESEFLKNLICAYGDQESDDEEFGRSKINMYEDEYDDTYDSALVGLKEPILADEPDKEEPIPEEPTKIVQKDVREPRPDDFCINPEILREKYEERRQARAAARGRGNRGSGPPSTNSNQNRLQKDRNKAHVGNHNRRNQSDYKKSRGMVPFSTR